MTFRDYYFSNFQNDLKKLNYNTPHFIRDTELFKVDENTVFFGGHDWSNFENDISSIKEVEFFILGMFLIVNMDLTVFTYYRSCYPKFREQTLYPKFGWSGFGPHYEIPKKLLNIPELKEIIRIQSVRSYIDDYIEVFIDEVNSSIKLGNINTAEKEFIINILQDRDSNLTEEDSDTVFELIISKLKGYIR